MVSTSNPRSTTAGPTTTGLTNGEERELLSKVANGDTAAFRTLYLSYHKRMSRFLMRFVHRHELIEEIINDTLYTVWCKAGEYRGDSLVSTWILGIGYRKALKVLRRVGGEAMLDTSVDLESIPMEMDANADQAEIRRVIDRALAVLPPVQRLAIELAYFSGQSCEEIAAIAACPVNTVKTRLFHARERLRELLPQLRSELLP